MSKKPNRVPFTVPERTLRRKSPARFTEAVEILTTHQLSSGDPKNRGVLEELEWISKNQDPLDIRTPLHRVECFFNDGHMTARRVDPNKTDGLGETMLVTTTGASHLHADVLPSRFWAGFKQLAALDADLAHQVWKKFADQTYKQRRVVRTVKMVWCPSCGVTNGKCGHQGIEVFRAIRAVVSEKYGLYSNVEMVQDIVNKAGHFASMPVLGWWLSDGGIRIRFLGLDPATAAFAAFDPEKVLADEPLPVIEVWNSETKRSTVGMAGGIWNLKTGGAVGHWDDRTTFNWRHVGRTSKISSGVQASFTTLTQTAQDVLNAYKASRNVGVEDPKAWLLSQLGKDGKKVGLPERIVKAAVAALEDDAVTPGGKLATIVDAMTIAASKEKDIYTSADVEKAAARLMRRGEEIAAKNGGIIPAPEDDSEDK
jgi:hypothetical protein